MLIVDENRYQKIRHGPYIRSDGSSNDKKLMVMSEHTIKQIKTSSHFIFLLNVSNNVTFISPFALILFRF
jgi:hypothetical protein